MKTDHTGNEVQIYLNGPYYREGCGLWGCQPVTVRHGRSTSGELYGGHLADINEVVIKGWSYPELEDL